MRLVTGDTNMNGAVYEDRGQGSVDMSVRLTGATVAVVETGATASAVGADALWDFTLPAGSYTFRVRARGIDGRGPRRTAGRRSAPAGMCDAAAR